jgi:hypothetical protein
MARTIISFDYALKTVFRDKANFDILSGFVSELLCRKVTVLELIDSEGNPLGPDGKTNRLDIKAKFDDGEFAVFEFQYNKIRDFLGKAVFNASRAVVEQVKEGDKFDFMKVYSINISYFNMGAKKEYVFRGRLNELTGIHCKETMPFSQSIHSKIPPHYFHPEYYLILPNMFDEKILKKTNRRKPGMFDQWMYVLKTSTVKSEFTAAGIQEAGERLDEMKMTPEERAAYKEDQYNSWRRDGELHAATMDAHDEGEAIGLVKGEAIGIQKGEAIGIQKEKTETIANLHKAGHSIETMSIATGLSQQEVTEIIKTIKNDSAP